MEVNVSSDQAMMQDQDGVEVSIEIVLDSIIKKKTAQILPVQIPDN